MVYIKINVELTKLLILLLLAHEPCHDFVLLVLVQDILN